MSFLYSIINLFWINYVIYWFLGLFNLSKKTRFITISILNLLELIFYVFILIRSLDSSIAYILMMLLEILCLISSYILFTILVIGRIKIFKSRRLKKFEREYNGTTDKHTYILVAILLILGIVITALGIYSYIVYKIIYSLFIPVFGFIFVILSISMLISNYSKKERKLNNNSNYILVIKTDLETICYKDLNKPMNEALNDFLNVYVVDNYGTLVADKTYNVIGVSTKSITDIYLNMIDMERISDNKIIEACKFYEKTKTKKVILDESNNIKDIKILK